MRIASVLLKVKRLEYDISIIKDRVNSWNVVARVPSKEFTGTSSITVSPRPYDIVKELTELSSKIDQLIVIRTALRIAYNDIAELFIKKEETEKCLKFFQGLNMSESFYGECDKAVDELRQESLIQSVLDELDEINEEIVTFEATKDITI